MIVVPVTHDFVHLAAVQAARLPLSLLDEVAEECGAWSKLQGTLTSQLVVDFTYCGETKKFPMPAIINFRNNPDEDVRRRAYEIELAAWDTIKEPIAASMNGVKGYVNTLNRRRGRVDALHSPIDQARIDR